MSFVATSDGDTFTAEKNFLTSEEYDATVLGDIARSIFR